MNYIDLILYYSVFLTTGLLVAEVPVDTCQFIAANVTEMSQNTTLLVEMLTTAASNVTL